MNVLVSHLIEANAARWDAMHLRAARIHEFDETARRLCAADAKTRYLAVAARTGVPWFIVAVIHEREAGQSWSANLAQGDPWNKKSRHVPKGRGPFKSWEDAAVDALTVCPPKTAGWTDWTAGGALTILEEYNGLGYAARGVPSAYVWSGSDQYTAGKYIADHVYRASAVDVQEGCAPLLSRMMAIDNSIQFAEAS